jgi:hypothetical protein
VAAIGWLGFARHHDDLPKRNWCLLKDKTYSTLAEGKTAQGFITEPLNPWNLNDRKKSEWKIKCSICLFWHKV